MDRRPLPDLTAFATVAELRSFRRAAKALGVSASALSHAIRKVEARLGVRLLHRTTRSVAPTEAGERLLARLGPALADIDEALVEIGRFRAHPAGRLRINMSRSAARLLIAPRVAAFLELYPEVRLEIVADDALTDIVAAGFDAGVRLGESLQADMVAVRLGPEQRLVVVGAPSYLARRGTPTSPAELVDHRCLRMRWPSGGLFPWEFEKDGQVLVVEPQAPLVVNDHAVMLRAATDGAGLAYVFESHVTDEIAEGRLVPLLADWCQPFSGFYLYYPSRRQVSPALRAFIDHMREPAPSGARPKGAGGQRPVSSRTSAA